MKMDSSSTSTRSAERKKMVVRLLFMVGTFQL